MEPLRLVFDMETSDPDDVLTLCVLATHPLVDLRAVTVCPGGKDQVGVVKHVLARLGRGAVPVGAGSPKKRDVSHVSEFHYRWLGKVEPAEPDGSSAEIMLAAIREGATELVTGGPLTNVYEALRASPPQLLFREWTCQGGFAGDNVVPPEDRLEKFAGRTTCPTFNLNGNVEASKALIATPYIGLKRFVTKNVCHGVFYDRAMHDRLPTGAHAGLDLLKEGMSVYFRRHAGGKALHDVIAAALAICPSAATWVSGKLYREKGEWGTREWQEGWDSCPREPDFITTRLDVSRFERVLAGLT